MTPQHRLEYWQVFDNFRKSREAAYAPRIARVLKQQQAEFISQYKEGNSNHFKLNAQPLTRIIESLYYDAGIVFADKVRLFIQREAKRVILKHRNFTYGKKGRMPIGFNARMQQLIEQYYGVDFLNQSEGITDTTRDLLVEVLTKAQAEGLGFDDIVKRLENVDLGKDSPKNRGRLIARTETVTAANSGAHLSANESGIIVNKIWIATQDDRTRHDHYLVSTEAIPIDEPFIVGAYEMMHPGIRKQPNGLPVPPREICNCRCCEAFEPVRDASGRVLLN